MNEIIVFNNRSIFYPGVVGVIVGIDDQFCSIKVNPESGQTLTHADGSFKVNVIGEMFIKLEVEVLEIISNYNANPEPMLNSLSSVALDVLARLYKGGEYFGSGKKGDPLFSNGLIYRPNAGETCKLTEYGKQVAVKYVEQIKEKASKVWLEIQSKPKMLTALVLLYEALTANSNKRYGVGRGYFSNGRKVAPATLGALVARGLARFNDFDYLPSVLGYEVYNLSKGE